MYCSYLSNMNKKVLKAAIKFSILLDQQLNNIHHFINKIHRFSLIFGFSLVGLKFFSSCFKEVIWQVAYIERFWCFFIMSFLLYFNFFTFLISFYQFFHFFFEPIATGQLKPFFNYLFRSKESQRIFLKKRIVK